MKKGFPTINFKEGKWRGTTPPRRLKPAERGLLESKERTGEPFPSWNSWEQEPGYGKAKGSYTEKLRRSLWDWMDSKGQTYLGNLTFDYRLSRKTVITVVGSYPYIKHNPYVGKGSKGMTLEISVSSINGSPVRLLFNKRQGFAWNRILAREAFLAISEGDRIEDSNAKSNYQ